MEWRDIENFPGYQVSDTGLVRSLDREVVGKRSKQQVKGHLLTAWINANGYLNSTLCKNGSQYNFLTHRLVAAAFIGPRPEGHDVCHGPEGKLNNSVENLTYGARSQNLLDRYRGGTMNSKPVRRDDGEVFRSVNDAAKNSNTRSGHVSDVCKNTRKQAGGYTFEYI